MFGAKSIKYLALAVVAAGALPIFFMTSALAGRISERPVPGLPLSGATLQVMIWNLGYGGLGKESDFVVDGGEHVFPPARGVVDKNLDYITEYLASQNVDVFLLQETGRSTPLNRWHDVLEKVDATLPYAQRAFYADIRTRFVPPPARAVHGAATYSLRQIENVRAEALPLEKNAIFPGVKRKYALLVSELPILGCENGWTLINVHLAAFDEGAETRNLQLEAAMRIAQAEYERGQFVVMGGDWNYQLAETNFPSTTQEEYLFWLHPFPSEHLPEGWTVAYDKKVPTVRTNERPYTKGENYTTIIDGFIVSPNVKVLNTRGADMGFEASDHQPVFAEVEAMGLACR